MNEESKPTASPPGRILSRLVKIVLVTFLLLFLFLFLTMGAGAGQIQVCIALIFGWIGFLKRTLPQISWNWDLICMAVLCSAIILFLAHRSLNWIVRSINTTRGLNWNWPFKWTVCGFVSIAVLFLVGMSVGGATHQIVWIFGSKEPWYERKPRFLGDMQKLDDLEMEFRVALMETNAVDAVRKAMWNSESEKRWRARGEGSLIQSFHVLLLVTNERTVAGVVVFPRDSQAKSRVGGYYITETDSLPIPSAKLQDLLKQHEEQLAAF